MSHGEFWTDIASLANTTVVIVGIPKSLLATIETGVAVIHQYPCSLSGPSMKSATTSICSDAIDGGT